MVVRPKHVGITDEAVKRGTGRVWDEWFTALDTAGAAALSHRDIARMLRECEGVGEWWSQMVTVAYEQARGLRVRHQKPGGFEVGASKTIAVPLATLWRAWIEPTVRHRWLPEPITVRTLTEGRSLRAAWSDGTALEADFYDRAPGRSQVAVSHGKLPDAVTADAMKAFWRDRLDVLKQLLES